MQERELLYYKKGIKKAGCFTTGLYEALIIK
jgi:hypothetical protein